MTCVMYNKIVFFKYFLKAEFAFYTFLSSRYKNQVQAIVFYFNYLRRYVGMSVFVIKER